MTFLFCQGFTESARVVGRPRPPIPHLLTHPWGGALGAERVHACHIGAQLEWLLPECVLCQHEHPHPPPRAPLVGWLLQADRLLVSTNMHNTSQPSCRLAHSDACLPCAQTWIYGNLTAALPTSPQAAATLCQPLSLVASTGIGSAKHCARAG